jgi:malate dehydrogenase (oxaloacetate-decarboxylating)(NADP+)
LKELGTADAIGPILLGLKKPVHILQLGSSVRSILNMSVIAIVDAQKSKVPTDEIVQKSSWWKRLRKEKNTDI